MNQKSRPRHPEKVKNPIIVDGDEKLVEIGKNNNWECVSFR